MTFKLDEDGAMRFEFTIEDLGTVRSYLEWRVYELGRNAEERRGSEKAVWRKHHKAIKAELEGFLKFESFCRQMPDEQESKE